MGREADPYGPTIGKFNNGFVDYGGILDVPDEVAKRIVFVPQLRSRVNVLGIAVNVLCPWLLFSAVYSVMIFSVHYWYPISAWCAVLSGFGLSITHAVIAYLRKQNDADPSWHTYAAFAFFLATALAAVLGDTVFWKYTNMYYDYSALNTYVGVDPGKQPGQMVMDAGRAYFSKGTSLDQKKAMGFKHGDVYCVVPISNSCDKLRTYDYWAVGVNCCSNPGVFSCGDHQNAKVRSAIRSMDLEHHPYFHLAVQQAEAAYGITASHPVFFHWTQDPLEEINKLRSGGIRYFMMGSFAYFVFNLSCVMAATFGFAKLRHPGGD